MPVLQSVRDKNANPPKTKNKRQNDTPKPPNPYTPKTHRTIFRKNGDTELGTQWLSLTPNVVITLGFHLKNS